MDQNYNDEEYEEYDDTKGSHENAYDALNAYHISVLKIPMLPYSIWVDYVEILKNDYHI